MGEVMGFPGTFTGGPPTPSASVTRTWFLQLPDHAIIQLDAQECSVTEGTLWLVNRMPKFEVVLCLAMGNWCSISERNIDIVIVRPGTNETSNGGF